ncbi:MAG: DUF433 domain-containing protein [Planctomycetes bacterium]|nr:DUF433 domain-containing protein [Planctomycetota bacterium]
MEQRANWRERIVADPKVLVGKPVMRDTRISVELVLELLGRGTTIDDVLRQYEHLTIEGLHACLAHAAASSRWSARSASRHDAASAREQELPRSHR